MNLRQMQRLVDAWKWDSFTIDNVMPFILFEYQQIYKQHKIFSDRKLTVLWIHKYGQSDGCNYLQTLPKELIRVILDFMDEQPLFYQLALMIMNKPGIRLSRFPSPKELWKSPYCGQLMLERQTRFVNYAISQIDSMPFKIIRQNYYWIRRAILKRDDLSVKYYKMKVIKYIMKYETDIDIFRLLHRQSSVPRDLPFIEAFKTKNRTALQFYLYENPMFEVPSIFLFKEKIKPPKYDMTYEQAIALIDEAKPRNK
eukprot:TRINITY_DN3671_c0_g1_i1.p1 TRINITY_DN3671_c0_g1~~TRINITY_DN3671_c0_g1_i1.p1  ORF type:complete len:255 (-),score=26.82 TRINITY_DN3671_c0_g1_i1:4-768(-)